MTWFRQDDSFYDHPKVKAIPRRYRLAAGGLWQAMGCYCARHLTEGRFTQDDAIDQLGTPRLIELLVSVGLWVREADGSLAFHDWEDYQEPRAVVLARRQATRERVAKWRKMKAEQVVPKPVTPLPSRTGNAPVTPPPTRPDPARPLSTTGTSSGNAGSAEPQQPSRVEKLIVEYREASPRGVPSRVAEKLAGEIHQLCRDGFTDDQIREGLGQLRVRRLGPGVLASLVDEVANRPADVIALPGRSNGKPTTDDKVAETLALGAQLSREARMASLNASARSATVIEGDTA